MRIGLKFLFEEEVIMNQGTILGRQTGRWIILAVLVAALGALLFLLPGGLVQAQDSTTIEYTENSTDVVVTLTAGDPEGATPITWSLPAFDADPDGAGDLEAADAQDNSDFKISQDGVLEFRISPNFEGAVDSDTDNTYNVVVQATDGDTGDPMDTRSWFKVTVNVSDLEEEGSIKLRPNTQQFTALLQPQVGVQINSANLMDSDGASSTDRGTSGIEDATYQWYRTTSKSATGTPISSTVEGSTGTESTYAPVHLQGGNTDVGKYLRVVATYEDGRGGGKTATAVSMYQTIGAIGDNSAPSFTDGAITTRGVREDAEKDVNIGFPVAATDPEAEEKLTYWLTAGVDANMFSIDAATGQLKTKDALDREADPSHEVMVNVTDSSGDAAMNQDTIAVTINVLQADERPIVTGTGAPTAAVIEIELMEGETDLDDTDTDPATGDDDFFTATDPEGGTITFSLDGADKDLFELNDLATPDAGTKVLAFKEKPDFEMPMDSNKDNVYEVTVQASDDANTGMKAVTVKVTNMQEDGEVKVIPAQPRIAVDLTAELTDSDVVVYGPMWQWQRGKTSEDGAPVACAAVADVGAANWMDIYGAMSDTYEPRSDDLDYCLRAVAMYNDGFHEGIAGTTPNVDVGIYPDIAAPDTRPNRFDKTADKALSAVQYPSVNIEPEFASAMTKRFVPENAAVGNDIGEPVTAFDPNGADDLVAGGYSLSSRGADRNSFDINSGTGQLMTRVKFNHEDKEMYTVTVTATDSFGATDSIRVDIYVADVDEAPEGTGATMAENTEEYDENDTRSVLTLSVDDPEGATPITWSLPAFDADPDGAGDLEAADAQDNSDFKISQDGVLEFRISPNFEGAVDSDTDNTYNVVVQATDGDTGDPMDTRSWFKVIVNVSDLEEEGSIKLRPNTQQFTALLQPQVGVQINSANLMDSDGASSTDRGTSGIEDATYQWYRTTSKSATGTPISSTVEGSTGTESTYAPVHLQGGNTDVGKYLRVVAAYEDGRGEDKTATAVSMYQTIGAIGDNSAPSFTDGAITTRGVREDAEKDVNIGFPVAATDPEAEEKLTYWLTAGVDANMFSIDAATGQLKTKDALDREADPSHEVMVNVTDSSGDAAMNQDTIAVTINVLQADERPIVTGTGAPTAAVIEIELMEGETDLDDTDTDPCYWR